jgi:hypothetical protein
MKILYTLLAIAVVAGGYVGYTKLNSNSKNINTDTIENQATFDQTYDMASTSTSTQLKSTQPTPTKIEQVSKNNVKICDLVSTDEIKNIYGGTVSVLSKSEDTCMYNITPQTMLSIITADFSDVSDSQLEQYFNDTGNYLKRIMPSYVTVKAKPITITGIDAKALEWESYFANGKINNAQGGVAFINKKTVIYVMSLGADKAVDKSKDLAQIIYRKLTK